MKGHQVLAKALAESSAGPMFGVMGDANLFMVDAFVRGEGGTFVAAAHEAGATLMALGYASVSGSVGVATVTHGPGLMNTLTALAHGVKASLPMVLVAGDTAAVDQQHLQKIAQRTPAVAAGAGFVQARAPETLSHDLAEAFRMADVGRRPMVLNVPAEFQWQDTTYCRPPSRKSELAWVAAPNREIDNAVGIIAAAKRPLVLAGRGAISANAKNALIRLARRIEAPLATTLKAKDLFRGEPFNLGIFGTLASEPATAAILQSDCVIAFGAGLNRYTTATGSLLRGKRVIQVNQDPLTIGRNVAVDAGLVGDPALTADLLLHWLDEAEVPPSGNADDGLRTALAAWAPPELPESGSGAIDLRRCLLALDGVLPQDRVLATDGGRFLGEAWTRLQVPDPRLFLPTSDFGSIGLGMAAAVGATFAAEGRPVLLLTGDGGFMNGGLNEFNTAVRYGRDLIVLVCNDGSYGAEHVQFRNRQLDPGMSLFNWPDFAPLAEALGGHGISVRGEGDLALVAEAIRARDRPLLLDIKLDPDRVPAIPK